MSRPSRRRVRRDPRGYILFLMMVFIPLLGMASMLAIDRTVGEVLSSAKQVRDKQAFFRADGSATICRRELVNRLEPALRTRLKTLTNLSSIDPNNPIDLLVKYAYLQGTSFGGSFSQVATPEGPAARLQLTAYTASNVSYDCTMTVFSRGAAVRLGPMGSPPYLFRYYYVVEGNPTVEGVRRQVTLEGTFSVEVQQSNSSFARYALFTNCQKEGNCATGSPVWFMGLTRFTGPVHTNGQFNFFGNPAGQFSALVDSVSTTALYYNSCSGCTHLSLNADSNGTKDVPSFGGGFQRGSDNIPMPAATDADHQRAKALEGASMPSSNGVYPGAKDTNGDGKPDTMTGGIYVKGDASVAAGVGGSSIAQYTITVGNTSYTVRVNYATKQTSIQVGNGTPTTYTGLPNGDGQLMLFVDGAVKSLGGTLQRDSQMTIAATGDIQITDHLRYENYTAGSPPSAEGTANILGLISWTGDVRISDLSNNKSAPNDITIHATVMTPNGEFRVDGYDSIASRGTATILGGVIENTYGSFGRITATSITGYGRNFVFDTRMGRGMAPPFFPTTIGGGVTNTVAGINDRPNWQQTN